MPDVQKIQTTCCIAGGGPAGIMAGYLLARAGVEVIVLEKHADFFRDFRGDTIHPSTLELLHELGGLDEFLKLPHQELTSVGVQLGDYSFVPADFSHLPTRCKFIALMPQWDFLDFLARKAKRYPTFHLKMNHEVTDLIREGDRIVGVRARTAEGSVEVRADLVIGADGRGSIVRTQSKLGINDLGAPFDVLWMRLPRKADDPERSLGNFRAGKAMVTIDRQDYWQCAFLIKKGALADIRKRGLPAFQADVAQVAPFLKDRVAQLDDWDKIKLLTVQINRLTRWHIPGLLCIGDSAHAMSPMGGVGINLAIQDAVAAANILAGPLREKRATEADLQKVQDRREFPTKVTQRAQVFAQEHFLIPALENPRDPVPAWPVYLLDWFPVLRRIPARLIGMGVRPEHVQTPEFPLT